MINVMLIAAFFRLNIRLLLDETACQILLTLGGKQGLKNAMADWLPSFRPSMPSTIVGPLYLGGPQPTPRP